MPEVFSFRNYISISWGSGTERNFGTTFRIFKHFSWIRSLKCSNQCITVSSAKSTQVIVGLSMIMICRKCCQLFNSEIFTSINLHNLCNLSNMLFLRKGMLHETISVNATLKTRTAILQVYFVRFQNVAAKKKKLLLNSFGLPCYTTLI